MASDMISLSRRHQASLQKVILYGAPGYEARSTPQLLKNHVSRMSPPVSISVKTVTCETHVKPQKRHIADL
jgi:hypothetical protein